MARLRTSVGRAGGFTGVTEMRLALLPAFAATSAIVARSCRQRSIRVRALTGILCGWWNGLASCSIVADLVVDRSWIG